MQEREAAEEYQAQTRERRARLAREQRVEASGRADSRSRTNRHAVSSRRKSQVVGLLLTFFFGPLGLFYSSVAASLGLILGAILAILALPVLGMLLAPLVWLASIAIGFATVASFNRRASLEDQRHAELVEAARDGR